MATKPLFCPVGRATERVDATKEDVGKTDLVLFSGIHIRGRSCNYISNGNEISPCA